jgi:chitinase
MMKKWFLSSLGVVILIVSTPLGSQSAGTTLPPHIIVGYWHNFENASGAIKLANVPLAYDVVDVAFADVQPGGIITFTPLPTFYATKAQFIADINLLHSRGQKVLLSIGGANATVQLNSSTDVQNFAASVGSIIREFGFDGFDLDLEGTSVILKSGDTDFRAPTTPSIVNLISAVGQILDQFPGGIILSMAPETAYVQGGYGTYSSIFGAYLPIIHALRDKLTYIHVQDYNTGSMYGRDGSIYTPGTPDFLVAMADMLVSGFRVDAFRETRNIFFSGLGPEKVLIGIPATSDAAGSGYMPFSLVKPALDYLYAGKGFGGSYQLASATGYPNFRGIMTWSVNWDVFANLSWSAPYRNYLDALVTSVDQAGTIDQALPAGFSLEQNWPNPFNPSTSIKYTIAGTGGLGLGASKTMLVVYDMLGRQVSTLVNEEQAPGSYEVRFDGNGLASGMYIYRLTTGSFTQTRQMILMK